MAAPSKFSHCLLFIFLVFLFQWLIRWRRRAVGMLLLCLPVSLSCSSLCRCAFYTCVLGLCFVSDSRSFSLPHQFQRSHRRRNKVAAMVLPTRKAADRCNRKGIKRHRPEIIVVDLKDHVLGRAAAIVAKQLLLGKKITAVRCEQLTIAGTEIRNKIKYLQFLRKRKLSNPKLGPFHHRSPSDVFVRTVRSMLPRYTKRGQRALHQLIAYEGIPTNMVRTGGRVVIPKAQRHYCYRSERPYTILGNMCKHVGWKYSDVVKKLETARVEKAARHHKKTENLRAAWKSARKGALNKMPKKNVEVLKKFGYA